MVKKISILVLTLAVGFFLVGCGKSTNNNTNTTVNTNEQTNTVINQNTNNSADSVPDELIGTWKSECLTPDPDSPWSEQHQFTFDAEGWATHIRWDWDQSGCSGNMNTITNEYLAAFPDVGQINLVDMGEGVSIYDIYSVSENTLLLGHGFRNQQAYSTTTGETPLARITSLNEYIQYQKVL